MRPKLTTTIIPACGGYRATVSQSGRILYSCWSETREQVEAEAAEWTLKQRMALPSKAGAKK